jgi:hypothetical protein
MRKVKALIVSAALIGFAAPAFADSHKDLAPSKPGATQVKKKAKKEEKKEGEAGPHDPNAAAPTPAPAPAPQR